ncbi:hypothetical protein [Hydrotalea sandarakina]|uniref:Uncharacterized protein n=1 Tax=Hydrotalea sandarakina TaxID=1004304 RepID=A0A2W7S1B6_9BACT|nr:hypothetical protein [Hydrotalea sandarakina]PZX60659.1 hypothetical protein LX80_02436 [Hydrotalea sandarakina]
MNTKIILATLPVLLFMASCSKDFRGINNYNNLLIPTIRIDKHFPNGILQFANKESFKAFYEKVEQSPEYAHLVLPHFKSFKTVVNNFEAKSSENKHTALLTQNSTPNSIVSQEEYLIDMKMEALPNETLQQIVNEDLDVIIENQLYQFTRIGQFQVNMDVIDAYLELFQDNVDNLFYNPNFLAIPNETPLGNNQYEVITGVIRDEAALGDDILNLNKIIYLQEINGGMPDFGGGGAPGINGVPDYYVNFIKPDFNNDNLAIIFNDWDKRRLNFKTRKIEFLGIYNKIEMKAKIQREKKFLWITYWGASYADELFTGFDNMSLETNYIMPHPNSYAVPSKPEVAGFADFKLGNHLLQALHVNISVSALQYSLTNSEVATYLDNGFNHLVGNVYTNLFNQFENKILNQIDRSYSTRWAEYTKVMNNLDNQYRLKWQLGKGEKAQGYSHENTWILDQNIGVTYKVNGGVPGGYPAQYNYKYELKAGSFYARARVGSNWHGIRAIIQKK